MKINLTVSKKEFKAIFNSAHNYKCDLHSLNAQNKLPQEWKSQIVYLKSGLNKIIKQYFNQSKEGK